MIQKLWKTWKKRTPTQLKLDAKYTLSDFRWNPNGDYYMYPTGRKVAPRQLFQAINAHNRKVAFNMNRYTDDMISNRITPELWQSNMQRLILENHRFLAEFGSGGRRRTTPATYSQTDAYVRDIEYSALRRFYLQIKGGIPTERQTKARVKLYAHHARVAYERGKMAVRRGEGMNEARRRLGSCSPHCPECLEYFGRGWVPINQAVLPTDKCRCGSNCCCSLEYRRVGNTGFLGQGSSFSQIILESSTEQPVS